MGLLNNLGLSKLKESFSKTRSKIVSTISEAFTGKAALDTETLDSLEEKLILADFGSDITEQIITAVRKELVSQSDRSQVQLLTVMKRVCRDILIKSGNNNNHQTHNPQKKPFVMLVMGVNGAGKTTTIGKLAYNYRKAGLQVVVGAADTFRAAANTQLEVWAERAGVAIVKKEKADPATVTFDTLSFAIKNQKDIVLIDTAGRLHTKSSLMEELKKIIKVIKKLVPDAPHEVFLVLDGNSGQNTAAQMEEFNKAVSVTGLVITKLDGTAKGGTLFQITSSYKIPVRYIGVGEGIEDLQKFDPDLFLEAIFGES